MSKTCESRTFQRLDLIVAGLTLALVGTFAHAQSTGTGIDINQHGFTGSWYEPATSGQGVEVEIFPSLEPDSAFAYVSWFTFDAAAGGADRQRWYTLSGFVGTGRPASLSIYQNVGGNFNAPPISAAQTVGSATLSFDTCDSGVLQFNFTDGSSRTGSIPLTRLTKNVTCSSTGAGLLNADFAMSGNWYDPATSGQGITVEVNPNSHALFLAWYTYAPNGAAAGAAGQRWYTGQAAYTAGSRSIPLQLHETTGGAFNAASPAPNTVPAGSGTLAFKSCTSATLEYSFTGGANSGKSGRLDLSRLGPVPPGCQS